MKDKSNTGSYLETFVNISLLIIPNRRRPEMISIKRFGAKQGMKKLQQKSKGENEMD
jgi:hypothetical protein